MKSIGSKQGRIRHLISVVVCCMLLSMMSACMGGGKTFEGELSLIPQANSITQTEGVFEINSKTVFVLPDSDEMLDVHVFLNSRLKQAAGFELDVASEHVSKNSIIVEIDKSKQEEAYELSITPDQVIVKAASRKGAFYGLITVLQLLPPEIESSHPLANMEWLLPCVEIKDQPRFTWRGMHMDFSRHFFSVDEVKQALDYMALYKLNTYHMHLTDDQGWRIEIKKYPLLTEKGAWRTDSKHDIVCKEKAKSNELFKIDERKYKEIDGQKLYGGFFTQDQIREIIAYADERCIEVVPEIDVPGHFKSAIDNYPYLSCTGEPGWGEKFSTPACLGQEVSYEVIQDILGEVCDLFPSDYVHIGGDEVNIESWSKCEKCQKEMSVHQLADEHELQAHFNRRIEKFLNTKGKRLMGWDEIVTGGLSKDASMMWWRNWAPKARYIAADNGNDMVISPDFEYYFDFTNEATPLQKVYNYEPVPADFTPEQEKHILGVQANVWSEWIPNFKRLQYQVFPRLQALAETGWSDKAQKDFTGFSKRLEMHYKRMDVMGIRYYIPPVEGLENKVAFVDSVQIELHAPIADLDIYYTMDGSEPTLESQKYQHPFYVSMSCKIKARAYKGEFFGELMVAEVEQQNYLQAIDFTPSEKGLQRWVTEGQFNVVEEVVLPAMPEWKVVKSIDEGEFKGKGQYSMVFKGYFEAKEEAIYKFATRSDDGSLLYINDKLVVDNGGNHAAITRSGMLALEKGWHAITIKFHQGGGGGELSVLFAKNDGDFHLLDESVCAF